MGILPGGRVKQTWKPPHSGRGDVIANVKWPRHAKCIRVDTFSPGHAGSQPAAIEEQPAGPPCPIHENSYMNKWLLCLLGLFALTAHAAETRPPSRIVMFGDSPPIPARCTTKMRGLPPLQPAYHRGRFSNGPVWLEQPTGHFRASPSQRGGRGATAVAYKKISWNPKYQVINNLDCRGDPVPKKDGLKPDDLVILWVGASDYLAYGWNTEQDAKRCAMLPSAMRPTAWY